METDPKVDDRVYSAGTRNILDVRLHIDTDTSPLSVHSEMHII